MQPIQIAIDGPASAGKSTMAKLLSKRLHFVYCDTGSMYRALTYAVLTQNGNISNESDVMDILSKCDISFEFQSDGQHIFLNSKDISDKIRMPDVSDNVSTVASYKRVREAMVDEQQKIARGNNIIMDGRDIGTAVLPSAQIKFFLIASVDERAERRYKENIQKGINEPYDDVKKNIEERDFLDSTREFSPLVQAEDAILIDSTGLSINDVVEKMYTIVLNYKNDN